VVLGRGQGSARRSGFRHRGAAAAFACAAWAHKPNRYFLYSELRCAHRLSRRALIGLAPPLRPPSLARPALLGREAQRAASRVRAPSPDAEALSCGTPRGRYPAPEYLGRAALRVEAHTSPRPLRRWPW